MLWSDWLYESMQDEEMNSLRDLINSAVLDSDMKGGLRWPLGEASSGGRYSVIGAWHSVTKAYKNSSFRLKARDADRYDFRTGTGETTREIYLKLKRIVSEMQASSFIGWLFPMPLYVALAHMRLLICELSKWLTLAPRADRSISDPSNIFLVFKAAFVELWRNRELKVIQSPRCSRTA